jgi:hypothetical protein
MRDLIPGKARFYPSPPRPGTSFKEVSRARTQHSVIAILRVSDKVIQRHSDVAT